MWPKIKIFLKYGTTLKMMSTIAFSFNDRFQRNCPKTQTFYT